MDEFKIGEKVRTPMGRGTLQGLIHRGGRLLAVVSFGPATVVRVDAFLKGYVEVNSFDVGLIQKVGEQVQ